MLLVVGIVPIQTTVAKNNNTGSLSPFWIAVDWPDVLDPPSIDLGSIEVSGQNPLWRTVKYIDHRAVEQHDRKTVGTLLTIECDRMIMQGDLARLQPESWTSLEQWGDLDSALKYQTRIEKRIPEIICSIPLPQKAPDWFDVNLALGEIFALDYEGPFTEYDGNNIYILPSTPHLRMVTARDTYRKDSKKHREEYYRYTFDCHEQKLHIEANYSFEQWDNGFFGRVSNIGNNMKLKITDPVNQTTEYSDFYITAMDEQSRHLKYVYLAVCEQQ